MGGWHIFIAFLGGSGASTPIPSLTGRFSAILTFASVPTGTLTLASVPTGSLSLASTPTGTLSPGDT